MDCISMLTLKLFSEMSWNLKYLKNWIIEVLEQAKLISSDRKKDQVVGKDGDGLKKGKGELWGSWKCLLSCWGDGLKTITVCYSLNYTLKMCSFYCMKFYALIKF